MTTEPRHPFENDGHNVHNTVTDGLTRKPITTRQRLQCSALTRPWAERYRLPRESPHRRPACYHRCHNTLTDHQTASSTVVPPSVQGVVPLQHTRQGLRRFAPEISYSVGSTARTSRASLLWAALRRNAAAAALGDRPHHIIQPHRNLVDDTTHCRISEIREHNLGPRGREGMLAHTTAER